MRRVHRRHFLKSAAAAAGLAWAGPAEAAPAAVRALWVVRTAMTSPAAIDDALDRAQGAGLNTVLVQVRGRADAFYASRLVPRSVLLERQPASFDPLAHAIRGARQRGLAVHAWFNLMLAAGHGVPLPAGHVLRQHPDWIMVPRDLAPRAARLTSTKLLAALEHGAESNEAEGLYLSPFAPAVGDHLEHVVRELVRAYPLDGLHFDFVRFPGPEFDHSRWARAAWRASGGRGETWDAERQGAASWTTLRQRAITTIVQRLARTARGERPRLLLSAAVFPDAVVAVEHRFQSWPAWATSGLLDAVCPMAYAPEREIFAAQVERARVLAGASRVWAGIGAWRLDVAETVSRARFARDAGLSGFVLFSHEWLAEQDVARLRAGLEAPPSAVARAR